MRIHSFTLLSLLLLAAQVFSEKVTNGAKSTQGSMPSGDPSVSPGRAHHKQRSKTSKSMANGKFVTKDQAMCRWAVTELGVDIALKVECTQMGQEFSCVFAGNPRECLKHTTEKGYWKQIGRALRKQKSLCANSRSVLKTRACRKTFPDSNLKLVNSTRLGVVKPRRKEAEVPREQSKVKEDKELSKVKEDVSSSPAVTQTTAVKSPECLEDPDVANQRNTALEFCGESWSSFCRFFLAMIQATTC